MKNKKMLLILTSLFFIGLIFGIAAQIYKSKEKERFSFLAQSDASTFIRDYSPRLGGDDPEVYLVEFLDPECESCRQFAPLVKSIMNEFEGKIQLVIRYAPFHQNSRFAIKIIEAARNQGKYWEALDVLFQHQPEWGSHHHPRPELIWHYLPQAGVNIEQIKKDMEDPKLDEQIQQDIKDAETLGVRGTPTFFVNGKALESFGYGPLREMILEELKK